MNIESVKQRKRVSDNQNLTLHYDLHYQDLPVQVSRGPLVKEWLEKIRLCLLEQLARHSRILALRVDLRFPRSYWGYEDGHLGNGFLADFKSYLEESLDQLPGNRNHDLMVLAAREYDSEERKPHFHVLILLNGNAIRGTGKWDLTRNNLYSRLYEAWAFALGMHAYEIEGLIQFVNGCEYSGDGGRAIKHGSILLHRGDSKSLKDLFRASSYLAKVDTKNFYDGCLPFISPRLRISEW